MVIQRFCFFLAWASILLIGLLWGASGGIYLFDKLFPGPMFISPIQSPFEAITILFLWVMGCLIGGAGALFGAILPLYFKFPNARRRFSWESKDPQFVFRFYQWYGTHLTAYGAARERGEH